MFKSKVMNVAFLVVTGTLMIYTLVIGIKNVFRYNEFRHMYQREASILDAETRRNRQYKQLLSRMKTDAYWELEARQRLGYIKPGETVYKFVKDTEWKKKQNQKK